MSLRDVLSKLSGTDVTVEDNDAHHLVQAFDAFRVLVVCGSPEPSSPDCVAKLAKGSDYVIACDAGACVCKAACMPPHAFVGDADSIDGVTLAWVNNTVALRVTFPPEKYATDLNLAIEVARYEAKERQDRLELTLTCAAGGRPDHALAVLGQLVNIPDTSPREVEDGFELRILTSDHTPTWHLGPQAKGHTFSIVSLQERTMVSLSGMKWDLTKRELPFLGDEGISNVVVSEDAVAQCHRGISAAYLLNT